MKEYMAQTFGDRFFNRQRVYHYDNADEIATIETRQDVSDLVRYTKEMYANTDERAKWHDGFNHVASIPANIYWDLHKQGIVQDEERFKAWLNDRDNRVFRTRPGRI